MKISNLNYKKILVCLWIISLVTFLTENAIGGPPQKREYWPTNDWRTSIPEAQGMDSAKLMIADEFIQNRLPDAFSLLIVRNGYLVFEKYYRWGSPEKYAVVHSVTKSVTSALIGIALGKGYLNGVDQKLVEFFPEYITGDLDPRKKELTLKHLLSMSAGFRWNDWGPDMLNWHRSSDWAKHTIQLPQIHDPGEVFTYNTSISHLLSIVLTKSTQTGTLDFAKQDLFEPLGMSSTYWHQGPQGYHIGGFGLGLSARDLAKFGFLYLNNGFWDGRSIVPEQWVKESTRPWMSAGHSLYGPMAYGYHWWITDVDGCFSYRAIGRRGQFIVVVPELDLVMVVTSNTAPLPYPTAIHYSPLFDLVAGSVKRARPPRKPPQAVALPAEVKAFVADFNQAIQDLDQEKIADLFSGRFLHNGGGKQMTLAVLMGAMSYWSKCRLVLTRFEPEGEVARVEGVIQDPYFEIPLLPGAMLIKEQGRWKWYGNQIQK